MATIRYFKRAEGYGDKNARRFEKDARSIATYTYPCDELTYPYTPLTFLMIDFIERYYLADRRGFETDDSRFWRNAERSAFFQYELLVNRNTVPVAAQYCKNLISVYRRIQNEGYNLAKPVPVTLSQKGHIVPLKGAKRIASLLSMGIETVLVEEFDRHTLSSVPLLQRRTGCVNHSALIFKKLKGHPTVEKLRIDYESRHHEPRRLARREALRVLEKQIRTLSRKKQQKKVAVPESKLTELVSCLDPVHLQPIAVVLSFEIEIIEWLYRRRVPCTFFLLKPAQEILDRSRDVLGCVPIERLPQSLSMLKHWRGHIWCSTNAAVCSFVSEVAPHAEFF